MTGQLKGQSATNGLQIDEESATVIGSLGNWTSGRGPLYRRLAQALRSAVERGDVGRPATRAARPSRFSSAER